MSGAGGALQTGATAALSDITGLNGVYPGTPIQATAPFAIVEIGPETDWGHKNGAGRELRLAVIVRDEGETPDRVRVLADAARQHVEQMAAEQGGWRIVSLALLRARIVQEKGGEWAALTEWRARMLAL
jgi:hypothetical protein